MSTFLSKDLKAIMLIAGPAMLTNIATPIGSSVVLRLMSDFGDTAVAAAAILGRMVPVAFAPVFALSGAVGPIIGQNRGNHDYVRVRQTIIDSLIILAVYIFAVWLLLMAVTDNIVALFDAKEEAAALIKTYNNYFVLGFVFVGALFIANAGFNNLDKAYVATLLNFARALLGTIPLALLGAKWFGAEGVLAAEIFGAVHVGIFAYIALLMYVSYLSRQDKNAKTVV